MSSDMSVSEFEAKYHHYLDDETKAKIDALDVGDRAYFWAYLKETIAEHIGREMLREMERMVIDGGVRPLSSPDKLAPKPFEYAEDSIRPGKWFARSCIQ